MKKVKKKQSIWGNWWLPIRKWFYPAWLIYELTLRFYAYAIGVHLYLMDYQLGIEHHLGETGFQILDLLCSIATFMVCTVFLTIPATFVLFKFFSLENLTHTRFESQIKVFF